MSHNLQHMLMTSLRQAGGLGPELRGSFIVSTIGSPTILATYDTATGEGTVNREAAGDSSGLRINDLVIGKRYRIDIQPATTSVEIRNGGVAGTVLHTVATRAVYIITQATFNSMSISAASLAVPNVRGVTIHSFREVL